MTMVLVCSGLMNARAGEPGQSGKEAENNPLAEVLDLIRDLESDKDPKCYATASRLEDFMYGTPLSEVARFSKIDLQKALIRKLWKQGSQHAKALGKTRVSADQVWQVVAGWGFSAYKENQSVKVPRLDGGTVTLDGHDLRQYASVAYSLRAILSVQQDMLLRGGSPWLPLDKTAIDALQSILDAYTLATLQLADRESRQKDQHRVEEKLFAQAWYQLLPPMLEKENVPEATSAVPDGKNDLLTLKQIIHNKLQAYSAYNRIAAAVFMRNIQVYFARYQWPAEPQENVSLKAFFNEVMIQFAADLYLGSQGIADDRKHPVIRVGDVSAYASKLLPHDVNAYEDVVFFPRLTADQQVVIESYDMDAFRDSGLHWQYIATAIDKAKGEIHAELDPFAAELFAETLSQFAVLLLRESGNVAREEAAPNLSKKHFITAGKKIQQRLNAYPDKDTTKRNTAIVSAPAAKAQHQAGYFFEDVSKAAGVDFRHSSSDWLSRLIRSYSVRDQQIAVLAVPPAFGGAGVAAEDIDNDGRVDLLLLSGKGNRLYLNQGKGKFLDITDTSGIDWKRKEDGKYGEPRQPLIADFDNDGLPDIFISYVNDAHRLYKNLGQGRFADMTEQAGLGGKGLVAGPALTFDFDNDGLLDIYIGYFGDYIHGIKPTLARKNTNGLPNKLFKNKGDFQFREVRDSGLENSGWTQALAHTDIDRDGWQDVIVGNDFGVNAYYRNMHNGKFENMAGQWGVGKPSYTMGIGITDLNNDLFPDVYISNIVTMDKDQKYVMPDDATSIKFDARKMAHMRVMEANDLFLSHTQNNGFDGYIPSSERVGRGDSSTGWSWGAGFLDTDNDADDDLYVTNGMNDFALYSSENPYYTDAQGVAKSVLLPKANKDANVFFLNHGRKLHNVSVRSGVNWLGNSRSVVFIDIDQDGDQDMILNNYHDAAIVYRNNAEKLGNQWIDIRLIGSPSKGVNRDAVGARIIAVTPEGKRIWREIRAGDKYLSSSPKQQHFGLGKETQMSVRVEWPNGETIRFDNLEAGYRYIIEQAGNAIGRSSKPR